MNYSLVNSQYYEVSGLHGSLPRPSPPAELSRVLTGEIYTTDHQLHMLTASNMLKFGEMSTQSEVMCCNDVWYKQEEVNNPV